ncbi:MAG: DUF1553 domain-containing protein [Planctomycetota bacterium]
MKKALLGGALVAVLMAMGGAAAQNSPFESNGSIAPRGRIDELVFDRLEEKGIQPARLSSDGAFVRRVFLDVIGTLPTAGEAKAFLLDSDADKRAELIDRLLERDEFADYWALKWGDLLRVKAEFPINLWPNAVQAYHRWIHKCIEQNVPYDRFARELLTSTGSNFRVPQVNFYRALQAKDPATIAAAVALTFMGERVDNWAPERFAELTRFFSHVGFKRTREWKEEIVYFDAAGLADLGRTKGAQWVTFPDNRRIALIPDKDPRQLFAGWLIRPENPWFARNIVNRAWYWLLGRGIIHEPDDSRPDNPPSNPELLAHLEREFVRSGYDLKALFRSILNSTTYQLSCMPRSDHQEAAALFAYYPVRRLDAEVLADALCQITGTTEEYQSPIPEPFTFIPETQRSIALSDGSITSPFLEMFGRPPRDSGLEGERNNAPSARQWLHLLNSSHVRAKLTNGSGLRNILHGGGESRWKAQELYLTVLSRYPMRDEFEAAQEYFQSSGLNASEAAVDVAWALLNNPEFLYRH